MYILCKNTSSRRIFTNNFFTTDPVSCPVGLFKLYLEKLNPNIEHLWQKQRRGYINYCDKEWYEPHRMGRDMLECFMKLSICKDIKLEGEYTNHSIRSTVISTLDRDGFEGRHIIALSSHKSEATIKEYAPKCPETKRKEMFDSLSNAMNPNKIQRTDKSQAKTDDTNDPPDIMDVKLNLPNFNIQEIDEFDTIDDDLLAAIVYDNTNPPTTTDIQTVTKESPLKTVTTVNHDTSVVASGNKGVINNPNQNQNPQTNQFNTQVITNNMQMRNLARIPAMYFPNSNVTINYNFNN